VKALRAALLPLHVAALAFGVYVASAAVQPFLTNAGTDLTAVAGSRFAVAASLIGLTLAYAVILYRKGFTPAALPAFLLSYVALGVIVDVTTRAMAKGFPPAAASDIPGHYLVAIAEIAVVGALAYIGWRWIEGRSRFPLI